MFGFCFVPAEDHPALQGQAKARQEGDPMRCIGVVSLVSRCSVKCTTTTGLTVSQILSRPPPSFLHCNNLLGRWKFPNTIIIVVVVVVYYFLRVPRILYCFLLLILLLSLRLLWVLGVGCCGCSILLLLAEWQIVIHTTPMIRVNLFRNLLI